MLQVLHDTLEIFQIDRPLLKTNWFIPLLSDVLAGTGRRLKSEARPKVPKIATLAYFSPPGDLIFCFVIENDLR